MSHDQSQNAQGDSGDHGNDSQGPSDDALGMNAGPQGLGVGLLLGGLDDRVEADADRTLQFTIAGGTVTAIQVTDGSQTFSPHIPSDATFTVGTGTVTETLAGVHSTTTIDYAAEASNPAVYQVASVTEAVNSPTTLTGDGGGRGFAFTVSGNTVTAEQFTTSEGGHSHSEAVPIPPDAMFTVGTGVITETFAQGDGLETLTFVQPSGQTLYALASDQTTFVPLGSAATALDVEPQERAAFTFSTGGSVTAAEQVNADGTTSSIALGGHVSFAQIGSGLVEETTNHGSHTSFEVFATGPGGGGIYTAIAHGEGSVDVAGLQTQLAELPSWVTNLI
ncbi:hypothetical protein [Phenylobacterium sp.]|jgi:hypothetical protein|uniref:hypothetical protein n=1 Tax=Phenylobacterium sp. TaxID=1871053 RepID=UPI002E353D01|nr:hypothetical protein [Phenylobacterium sp.]HEX3366733.1 hypothetical protein [Phenylobacterium sp.]